MYAKDLINIYVEKRKKSVIHWKKSREGEISIRRWTLEEINKCIWKDRLAVS